MRWMRAIPACAHISPELADESAGECVSAIQEMTTLRNGVYAAILAGGQSQRMGTDKSDLVRPDGKTQLVFTLECLEQAGLERILLNGASHDRYRRIDDIQKNIGPLGGIHALLKTVTGDNSPAAGALVIVPCDMPYLTTDVFHHLMRIAEETGKSVAYQGSFFPFVIVNTSTALSSLNAILNSDRKNSIKHFLNSLECVFIEPSNTEYLKSCNTPEDWSDFLYAYQH